MREELRSYISFVHGPSAWDEIVRTEAKMRKEQREQVYKRQEFIDSLINGVLIALFLLAGVGGLITLLYFIGVQQDKW